MKKILFAVSVGLIFGASPAVAQKKPQAVYVSPSDDSIPVQRSAKEKKIHDRFELERRLQAAPLKKMPKEPRKYR